jgi:hypothetical protein
MKRREIERGQRVFHHKTGKIYKPIQLLFCPCARIYYLGQKQKRVKGEVGERGREGK